MEQTYEQALNFVHSMPAFSSKPGLTRIKKLLDLLDNPHKSLKFIHVAGTNGKGSVCSMCTSVLQNAGYKTGMYISPFVVDFRERFQINGNMISKADFLRNYQKVKKAYDDITAQGWECNEYDFITALAMLYFMENECEIVCLEVGLGGGMDATNIIDTPQVSVITKISYDHMAVLGDTIEQIAHEKAGIIKPDSICVSYPEQKNEALGVIMERCAEVGSRVIIPNSNNVDIIKCDSSGSEFIYDSQKYYLNLIGNHQILNAITAIEALSNLRDFKLSNIQIAEGISKTAFPGRMEVLQKKPLVVADGAHNPDGLKVLCETINIFHCYPKIAVMGMVKDKQWQEAIPILKETLDLVLATEPNSPRKLPAEILTEELKEQGIDTICSKEYTQAIRLALKSAGAKGGVFVFGSLFLVSDIRNIFMPFNDNWI